MKKLTATVLVIFLVFSFGFSQNTLNKTQKDERPVQLTFCFPIGSNGINAYNYSNWFSVNSLIGINGGVRAFEVGGIANINDGNVQGFQASGILNSTSGDVIGLQTSGIANFTIGNVTGLQSAGILNFNSGTLTGFQVSGICNFSLDSVRGAQVGLLNYARKVDGVQFGLINVALKYSSKHVPIGLLSIVKGGLQEVEVTGGDAIYSNANFKIGVPKFYTIFKVGYSSYKNDPVFTSGLGFRTEISLKNNHKLNIDLSSNTIALNSFKVSDLNSLNKLDLNYKYTFNDRFSLIVGPSLNVYVSQYENEAGGYGTLNIPYTIHKKTYDRTGLFTWVGLNMGVSIRL